MKPVEEREIRVRGAAEGPLQEVDLDLPLDRFICFTGRCGSGSRAMAADVLYAESRRRYMLSLSPFERESLGGIGRVAVESITGLPPAMYFNFREERSRGTVASFLQVDGYLGQLLLQRGEIHCPDCGGVCCSFTPEAAAAEAVRQLSGERGLLLAPLALEGKAELPAVLRELRQAGFLRVRLQGVIWRLDGKERFPDELGEKEELEVVVDRLVPDPENLTRLIEGVRNARAIARGRTWLVGTDSGRRLLLNQQLTCARCGASYDDLGLDDFIGRSDQRSPLALGVSLAGKKLADIEAFSLEETLRFLGGLEEEEDLVPAICRPLEEARSLGLEYLVLDQPVGNLSTGERQRLVLAGCLSSGLVGILYVFEGLGTGLHPARPEPLIEGLRRLVEKGNTVVAVDHSPQLIEAADQVWRFAAGQVQKGTPPESRPASAQVDPSVPEEPLVSIRGEVPQPLKLVEVQIPLQRLVCITGVSGSGKSLFLRQVVVPALRGRSGGDRQVIFRGHRGISRVVEIGEQGRGRERTLLAELGLSGHVARLYADLPTARERGYPPEWFGLETPGGRCTTCEGRGILHYDLQFLEDISLTCPACEGRRYRPEILDITWRGLNMSDVLDLNIEQASQHFARDRRMQSRLEAARRCGLGNRLLGDESGSLERGEWLRLRLAGELGRASGRDLIVLDAPAGGDHPEDVDQLVQALKDLVSRGVSVVVADHHPAVLAAADWVIELGPGAGPGGGEVVASGRLGNPT